MGILEVKRINLCYNLHWWIHLIIENSNCIQLTQRHKVNQFGKLFYKPHPNYQF